MSKCFELIPTDTLFFRGSIPMESGLQNVSSIFPPPISVLQGAFWSASCEAKNPLKLDYHPTAVDMPKVKAFYIKKNGRCYVPAPATWYYDSDCKVKTGKCLNGKELIKADFLDKNIIDGLKIKTSSNDDESKMAFVVAKKDAQPLSDCWIELSFLLNNKKEFDADSVLLKNDVYVYETRINVALDNDKHTIEHQLFSSTHIRLMPEVSMIVVFNDNEFLDYLGKRGKLQLGGENKIVSYREGKDPLDDFAIDNLCKEWLATIPIEAADIMLKNNLISSGKLFVSAGWDMNTNFHKPSTSWIPSGAVFNENINDLCIPLL